MRLHLFYFVFVLMCRHLPGWAQSTGSPPIQEHPELQTVFANYRVNGAFLVYDVATDRYLAFQAGECGRGTLPGSTFKIINALIGLETGVLTGPDMAIPWDSVDRHVPGWNKAHTLSSAFRGSVVPYFQEVARRIGVNTMRAYLKQLPYGRMYVDRATLDNFWLTGKSSVTLFDQIALLRVMLSGQLPFSTKSLATVRQLMQVDSPGPYRLFAKTGWVGYGREEGLPVPDEPVDYGWYVGYVEQPNGQRQLFATRLEAQAPVRSTWPDARRQVTLDCLRKLGLVLTE